MPNEQFYDSCQNCGQSQNYNQYEQHCYNCGHNEVNFPLKVVDSAPQKWVVEQHSGHLEYFDDKAVAQNYADACVYACYPPRLA